MYRCVNVKQKHYLCVISEQHLAAGPDNLKIKLKHIVFERGQDRGDRGQGDGTASKCHPNIFF